MSDMPDRENEKLPVTEVPRHDLRRSLRYVTVAWMFGAAWLYITSGAAMTQFGKLVGISAFGFGVLAALPYMGALAQLPSSFYIERYGGRRRFFLITASAHRLLWVVVAVLPWVLPESWQAVMVLLVVAVSAIMGHISSPAWVSWMADLVPSRLRGRYFSRRVQLGHWVGLCVTVVVGVVLDHMQLLGMRTMLCTISVLLAVAAVSGTVDILLFAPVPDTMVAREKRDISFWEMVREPLADRSFRRFLAFTATMTFGMSYVPQFVWLYLFDVVKLTNLQANMMLVVASLLVMAAMIPVWGRLIDRLGRKPVLLITGLLVVHGGAVWIFVTPERWVLGYMASLVATAAWPGFELANFNLVLTMSGSEKGRRSGSAYVAINSFVAAVAGLLGGLFAGAVADAFEGWKGTLFGWPLTYHGLLFIASGGFRLAALGWLMGLQDSKAVSTRMALRYIGTNLYSTVQQAIFIPARFLGAWNRWTYRLNSRKPPRDD